jgi:predicted RNA methylase
MNIIEIIKNKCCIECNQNKQDCPVYKALEHYCHAVYKNEVIQESDLCNIKTCYDVLDFIIQYICKLNEMREHRIYIDHSNEIDECQDCNDRTKLVRVYKKYKLDYYRRYEWYNIPSKSIIIHYALTKIGEHIHARHIIPEKMEAVDLGCGIGQVCLWLHIFGCTRVVGIDKSAELIHLANEYSKAGENMYYIKKSMWPKYPDVSQYDIIYIHAPFQERLQKSFDRKIIESSKSGAYIVLIGDFEWFYNAKLYLKYMTIVAREKTMNTDFSVTILIKN